MVEKTTTIKYLNFLSCIKDSLLAPELSLETMAEVISRQLTQSQLNHFTHYLQENYEKKYGETNYQPYTKKELKERGILV